MSESKESLSKRNSEDSEELSSITNGPPTIVRKSVNLYSVPHSRMKELVTWPLQGVASLSDVQDLEPSLQAVYEAMWELKSHEYIENTFIMDRLKARLHARQVYNELVCNCHEDSKLLEVIGLVEKVYTAQTQVERCRYGQLLQVAIRSFLDDFIHHMAEEEKVFQPLLVQNFDHKELEDMNETVIRQHHIYRQKVKNSKSLKAVKRKRSEEVFEDLEFGLDDLKVKKSYCQEVQERSRRKSEVVAAAAAAAVAAAAIDDNTVAVMSTLKADTVLSVAESFPDEVILVMFAHLSPRDLLNCARVCKRWHRIAFSSGLWKSIYPTQWARGLWSFDYVLPNPEKDEQSSGSLSSSSESVCSTRRNSLDADFISAAQFYRGIAFNLLPQVGLFVSTLILSSNRNLSSSHVRCMLRRCVNVRRVDLSHTNVTDTAFANLYRFGALRCLEELNMSGCVKVNDQLLAELALCYYNDNIQVYTSHLRSLSLSGCKRLTSLGLVKLAVHTVSLQELDLSGCFMIDGETLTEFVRSCSKLRPEKLAYCNDIEDGPYQDTANGCYNLECSVRFCCQNQNKLVY